MYADAAMAAQTREQHLKHHQKALFFCHCQQHYGKLVSWQNQCKNL